MCQESFTATLKKAIEHPQKNTGLIADVLRVIPVIIKRC